MSEQIQRLLGMYTFILHNRSKSLVKQLLLLNISVNTLMIHSVTTCFTITLLMTVKIPVKKCTSQNFQFNEEDAINAGKELRPQLLSAMFVVEREGMSFQEIKQLLCSNVKVLQE